jgi:hypothetical protein
VIGLHGKAGILGGGYIAIVSVLGDAIKYRPLLAKEKGHLSRKKHKGGKVQVLIVIGIL